MKPSELLTLLLASLIGLALWSKVPSSKGPPQPDSAPAPLLPAKWQAASYEEAALLGRQQARNVVVYFGAKWCAPCRRMEATLNSPKVVNHLAAGCVFAKVDADQRRDLVEKHAARSLPSYVLLAPDGRLIRQGTGYKSPDEFLGWVSAAEEVPQDGGP